MKKNKIVLLLAIALLFGISTSAQKAESSAEKPKTDGKSNINDVAAKDYEDIAAKLKTGDLNVDFGKLRRAYTKTEKFSPYGGGSERSEMNAALKKNDYRQALKMAEKRLGDNYVDLYAHQIASIASRELKNESKAEFHKSVFQKLIDAMLASGDGKTAETAIFCISTSEQYVFMSWFGFQSRGQSVDNSDGHIYDVQDAFNPETGEERKFWFNIDEVFGRF